MLLAMVRAYPTPLIPGQVAEGTTSGGRSLADPEPQRDRLGRPAERVTVTVHGKPSAVLIATEDLEPLEKSIAILSDPGTLQRLRPPTPS
jgi:hypothetical protein